MGRIMNEEEFKESMKNAVPEAPKKKPGPKPGTKRKKAAQRKAPVAAEQKAEALSAATELMRAFADFLALKADKCQKDAEKYIEYTDILEGMK